MGNTTVLSVVLFGSIILCFNEAVLFKFTNIVCKNVNESWINVKECRLKAISRSKTTLNVDVDVLHPVNDAVIDGQLFQKANGYKPWLYKAKIDGCRFMKKAYNPIAIIVFKLFRDFTNINHTCPYAGSVFVKGLHLRSELLPHPIPTGDYLLELNWRFNRKVQITSNIYFSFVEDL